MQPWFKAYSKSSILDLEDCIQGIWEVPLAPARRSSRSTASKLLRCRRPATSNNRSEWRGAPGQSQGTQGSGQTLPWAVERPHTWKEQRQTTASKVPLPIVQEESDSDPRCTACRGTAPLFVHIGHSDEANTKTVYHGKMSFTCQQLAWTSCATRSMAEWSPSSRNLQKSSGAPRFSGNNIWGVGFRV